MWVIGCSGRRGGPQAGGLCRSDHSFVVGDEVVEVVAGEEGGGQMDGVQ